MIGNQPHQPDYAKAETMPDGLTDAKRIAYGQYQITNANITVPKKPAQEGWYYGLKRAVRARIIQHDRL